MNTTQLLLCFTLLIVYTNPGYSDTGPEDDDDKDVPDFYAQHSAELLQLALKTLHAAEKAERAAIRVLSAVRLHGINQQDHPKHGPSGLPRDFQIGIVSPVGFDV